MRTKNADQINNKNNNKKETSNQCAKVFQQ